MKAIDLYNHFKEIGTWVNWDSTTDHVLAGDREAEVKGVAVAWQCRTAALKKAVELGCNVFVTHEQHIYPEPQVTKKGEVQPYEIERRDFIEDNGLVIIRCHDVWDQMPEVGIVDSWGAQLELTDRVVTTGIESVYPAPSTTLLRLAKYVAQKTAELGQDGVEMLGDPNAKISKVGIGCGAGTNYEKMVSLGADAIIASDDGTRYWGDGSWALDAGIPVVVVAHCISEEPGMKNLAAYIGEKFGVKSVHIPQGSMYKLVGHSSPA